MKEDNRPPNNQRYGDGVNRSPDGPKTGPKPSRWYAEKERDALLDGLDVTLDASHKRMEYALAVQTARLEARASQGSLTLDEMGTLDMLSRTWRTLVVNQPAPDLGDLSDEQLAAKLAAVKERGK